MDEATFKAPLWKRIFDDSVNTIVHSKDAPVLQTGGDAVMEAVQEKATSAYGNFANSFPTEFTRRVILRTFILNLAMYTAILLLNLFTIDKMIMAIGDGDESDFSTQSFGKKYGKILLVYVVFVILAACINYVYAKIFYVLLAAYVSATAPRGTNVTALIKQKWKYVWESFPTSTGTRDMSMYTMLSMIGLGGLICFFIVYAFFVRSFIMQLDYPDYTKQDNNDSYDSDEKEYNLSRKFLVHQMLFITYFILMTSCLVIAHNSVGITENFFAILLVFVIGVYAMFITHLLRLDVQRMKIWMMLNLLALVVYVWLVFLLHPFIGVGVSVGALVYIVIQITVLIKNDPLKFNKVDAAF